MLEVFKSYVLNYYTSSCGSYLYPAIQPHLIFLFSDPCTALASDCTHFWFSILFPDDLHPIGGILIFIRQNQFSLNFPFFFARRPFWQCKGQHLTKQYHYSLLSFLVHAPPIHSCLIDGRIDSFSPPFFSPPETSHPGGLQLPSSLWDSKDTTETRGGKQSIGSSPMTPNSFLSLLWQSLLFRHVLCSLLSCPLLLQGGTADTIQLQLHNLFLQFSESSLKSLSFLF